MVDLAKRAVACKGWRWMPGMLTATGYRVCNSYGTWPHLQRGDTLRSGLHFPDLTDPATVGCLLALVREAKGAPLLQLTNSGIGYTPWIPDPLWAGTMCDTEAEALVAALESADG
jgi:hypothetical protein